MILWEQAMSRGGMDGWHNYIGPDLSGYYCGPAVTRDSDALARSNYRVALDMLGGESPEVEGEIPAVMINAVRHWACGWIDQILVHKDSPDKIAILRDIEERLEEYPILDEEDYWKEEDAEMKQTWDNYHAEFELSVLTYLGMNDDDGLTPEQQEQLSELAQRIYWHDCGYRGIEDGWVSVEAIERYAREEMQYDYRECENFFTRKIGEKVNAKKCEE